MTDEAARRRIDAAQARAQALLRQGRCATPDAELDAACTWIARYARTTTGAELATALRAATEAARAQLARYDAPVFVRG